MTRFIGRERFAADLCRGIAKLVKALDFDSSMRRFESFFPCQILRTAQSNRQLPPTGRKLKP